MGMKGIEQFSVDLYNLLKNYLKKNRKILLLSHESTDTDGVASVLGINYIIHAFFNPKQDSVIPILSSINKSARNLLNNLNINKQIELNNQGGQLNDTSYLIIILDTNNLKRLKSLISDFNKINSINSIDAIDAIIIIDHHEFPDYLYGTEDIMTIPRKKIELFFIETEASSCSEIITAIWREWEILYGSTDKIEKLKNNQKLSESREKVSQFLLMGIFSDSDFLKYSDNEIIPLIGFLTEKGADIRTVRELTQRRMKNNERIARIKGAIRCDEPIIIRNWICVFTYVNAHEGSVCRALVNLGADIAFCFSQQKKGEFRIIVRSSERIQLKSNMNFGSFMEDFGKKFSGHGGGHKGAAGMNGSDPPVNIKEIVISKLRKELNKEKL
ncbi:MAG: DHH family phosphoesterase [Promethearchaeota archaeon]